MKGKKWTGECLRKVRSKGGRHLKERKRHCTSEWRKEWKRGKETNKKERGIGEKSEFFFVSSMYYGTEENCNRDPLTRSKELHCWLGEFSGPWPVHWTTTEAIFKLSNQRHTAMYSILTQTVMISWGSGDVHTTFCGNLSVCSEDEIGGKTVIIGLLETVLSS